MGPSDQFVRRFCTSFAGPPIERVRFASMALAAAVSIGPWAGAARADDSVQPPPKELAQPVASGPTGTLARPPPPRHAFLQYGVGFTVEGVASAGPVCSDAVNPCILGSGGGIVVRVGWRPTEDLYIGGAYGFSKQDPNKLYRLGILQQARAELRYYFPTGFSVSPFAVGGVGAAAYGNEWQVDTWGPSATLGGGAEV